MANSLDFAGELIAAAERDLVVLKKGVADSEVPIEILGFHCQQAVEKCIKAVLAIRQVEFRKIHDLKTLTDLAKDAGLVVPLDEQLDALTPFAVEFRYRGLAQDRSPVEREKMVPLAEEVRKWASGQLDAARTADERKSREPPPPLTDRSAPPD